MVLVLFLVLLDDMFVGHVSRGEQKAQTASQQCPGTASAFEGPYIAWFDVTIIDIISTIL